MAKKQYVGIDEKKSSFSLDDENLQLLKAYFLTRQWHKQNPYKCWISSAYALALYVASNQIIKPDDVRKSKQKFKQTKQKAVSVWNVHN